MYHVTQATATAIVVISCEQIAIPLNLHFVNGKDKWVLF